MTVKELRKLLKRFDKNLEVRITWESTIHGIDVDNIYIGIDVKSASPPFADWDGHSMVLFIDADENSYKKYLEEISHRWIKLKSRVGK